MSDKPSIAAASPLAISPLDGRYHAATARWGQFFSEFALMRARCEVELVYLLALDETGLFPPLTAEEKTRVGQARERFTEEDFARIKEIEGVIRHDVKACEIFLRERLGLATPGMLHFGLTSEDVNNLAYSRLMGEFIRCEQVPTLDRLIRALCRKVRQWRDIAFPARTHGQVASPSTLGKEMAVFVDRLLVQRASLVAGRFRGKLAGATGTGAAWRAAFPTYDWLGFAERFVRAWGLEPALATTQVESHDSWATYFALVGRIDGIVRDLDVDVWLYETLGYLGERAASEEVGSSTMPHKVNPIRFENSEGNLHVADALLSMLCRELTHSRLQRDLSDSTISRTIGVALSHSLLAWQQTLEGLARVEARPSRCGADLAAHPELLAEPIQTILRTVGVDDPYERLRLVARGKSLTRESLEEFVEALPVGEDVKTRVRSLRVEEYTGYAAQICDRVLKAAGETLDLEGA